MNARSPSRIAIEPIREPNCRVAPRVRTAAEKLVVEQDLARGRLYRMHLQASVTTINRLALDVAATSGDGPLEVAAKLTPPFDWPWRALGRQSTPAAWWAAMELVEHGPAPTAAAYYHASDRPAAAVQSGACQGADVLRFHARRSCIDVEGRLGPGFLFTRGACASLEIPDDLPRAVAAALPGRDVSDLVGHPLLDGRSYVIRSTASTAWGHLRIDFATGVDRVLLPWAELLRGGEHG